MSIKQEIERKFLVNKEDLYNLRIDSYYIEAYQIEQAYLSFKPEVRIEKVTYYSYQQKNIKYYFTIKSNGDLIRQENEFEISESTYRDLLCNKQGHVISKMRHLFKLDDNLVAECDDYTDIDLCVVEVEFNNEDELNNFIPPDWFGEEVTYDKRYKNKNIAKNG